MTSSATIWSAARSAALDLGDADKADAGIGERFRLVISSATIWSAACSAALDLGAADKADAGIGESPPCELVGHGLKLDLVDRAALL